MRRIMILFVIMISCLGWTYDQIIPVVAKASGGYNSTWQSSLTLYNAGKKAVNVTLSYLPAGSDQASARTVALGPGGLFDQADLLGWLGLQGVGSLTVSCPDEARTALGVVSRTYALTTNGTFGQDVPAVPAALVPAGKSELFMMLPADPAKERFNFGIRTLGDASVAWELLGADGASLGRVDKTYAGPGLEQYGQGVKAFFNTDQDGRILKAVLESGQAILYGSTVDNGTNDAAFRTAQPLQANQPPVLVGVDASSDGTVNFTDTNGDGVLDTPIPISVGFPFHYPFTIVATDPEGDPLTFSLKNPPVGMNLLSTATGDIYYQPSNVDIGKTINLEVDISDGFAVTAAIIPLQVGP